jgi:hypothetical protein
MPIRLAIALLLAPLLIVPPAIAAEPGVRPTDPAAPQETRFPAAAEVRSNCSSRVCVNWVRSGVHAPAAADNDNDGVPNFVESLIEAYSEAENVVVDQLGFAAPLPDSDSDDEGLDERTDVYLVDIDRQGYCLSDDPDLQESVAASTHTEASVFCLVDNDLSSHTGEPADEIRREAARTSFEAIAAAYDALEDERFTHASATWIADVVFDDLPVTTEMLTSGPVLQPDYPLDFFDELEPGRADSAWLFVRFLTEYLGIDGLPDNGFIRQVWELAAADGGGTGTDMYSMQAIAQALSLRELDLAAVFASFNWLNWVPLETYSEGQEYVDTLISAGLDPLPFVTKTHYFSKRVYTTGWWGQELFHMSAINIGFRPKRGVASTTRLRVQVDGPKLTRFPQARFHVFYTDGTRSSGFIRLRGDGTGGRTVDFGGGDVDRVILTITNASARYVDCGTGTSLSCDGRAIDDLAGYRWRATAV